MDDDLLKEFVNESRDHLSDIEADLLRVEEGGANIDEGLVNKVFRAAHSIKGGSGFFGLNRVKELSHKAETILDMIRSRKMAPNAEVTNILLAAFDKLRDMMNNIAESEQADISDLVVSLTGLASSYLPPQQKAALYTDMKLSPPQGGVPISIPQMDFNRAKRTGKCIYLANCDLIHDIERKGQHILDLFRKLTTAGEILDCAVDFTSVGTLDEPVGNRLPLRFVVATVLEPGLVSGLFGTLEDDQIQLLFDPHAAQPAEAAPAATICLPEPPAAPLPPPLPAPPAALAEPVVLTASLVVAPAPAELTVAATHGAPAVSTAQAAPAEDSLRVNVELLERLMNLAGELVLSRNQLRAAVAQDNRQSLLTVNQRVNQVTSEIQDVIMQTRLQPIGNVFAKFPRVVRDLSRSLSKEIDLDIQGKDVALDKSMIEGLSDPLSHMVRNAVDHGVETTAERIKAGKKGAGTVRIEARHEAGQVIVEIADDGKGIDPNRVAEAAVRKGLITAEKIRGMSDRDKQALIFLPGLSTAQTVTDVSGRGVGMDVVKTNLDRLGGVVEIDSVLGKGSTFRIKLPLTLAIIPSLIVSVGDERFAIPQTNIEELLRLRPEEVQTRIEVVGDSKVLLLRDRVLPLANFAELIGSAATTARSSEGAALEIAVVTTGTMTYGLVVGCFHDTEEVVVKPLGRRLKHLREYSGATILGDGMVALILDVAGVAVKAGLASASESERAEELAAQAEARLRDTHSLLLFQNAPGESFAVPLELVQRIERIKPAQVERFGQHRTMQYHGGSLPLVALADAATVGSLDGVQDLVVLVANVSGREVGLLGAMPVDVIETQAAIDQTTHRQRGIVGSAILREQTTLIADLYEIVDAVHPEWRAHAPVPVAAGDDAASRPLEGAGFSAGESRPALDATTLLLAEDSDFFRAQVQKYLEEDGYRVLAAPDGEAAWELLLQNLEQVRLLVTDIEMPRLTGLGLTARIRADARTAHLPIVAVSSLAGDEDVARGKQVGVNEYLVKLDRDRLLGCLHEMLGSGAGGR